MRLDYLTAGDGEPRGKQRVYFTCHPADREESLPLLSGDILARAGYAVIWYDAEPEAPYDGKELADCLDRMQMVVIAVTHRFLREPNRARDTELPYALDHHIPVLPVLLEPGLEWEFSRTCAEVQLVNRYVSDPTATPYEDVLEEFLETVLVGDDLAEKIRDAFDAYVFLSYRKKDRRHAQRLMHLIHENPQYRDIAIWYDEYLVPGEDFNKAIRAAFDRSKLFALAVTPNLLEKGNYVMETEFPLARKRKKNEHDLEIVPVEMYEEEKGDPRTDREALKGSYEEIPPVEDEHDRPAMNSAFIEALGKISKKENDGSAQHSFFIGLAYLCGIDVEVNHERALKLITEAATAKEPCFDATEKLVDMYRTGDGVKRDARKALEWQEYLVAQYRAEYEKNYSPDEHKGFGTKTYKALITLSDMRRQAGDRNGALAAAEEAIRIGSGLEDEVGMREATRDTAVVLNRIGGLYRDLGDIRQAQAYYRQALEIYERLAREIGTARARRDLSVSMERMGDIYRRTKDFARAEQMYAGCRALREALAEDTTAPGPRRDLSSVLVKQGNLRKAEKNYDEALRLYREAADIDRVLAAELKTDRENDDYGISLMKAGDMLRKKGMLPEAAENQRKAVEIFTEMAERTESLRSRQSLATALEKLARALGDAGQREEAEGCMERAVRIREAVAAEAPSTDTRHELAVSCYEYAGLRGDAEAARKAMEIWEELGAKRPEYGKYADSARKMLAELR